MSQSQRPPTKLSRAKAVLQERLKDGPRPRKEVEQWAKELEFSFAIFDRARTEMGVVTKSIYVRGKTGSAGNVWSLPEPDARPAGASPLDKDSARGIICARIERLEQKAPHIDFVITLAKKAEIGESALKLYIENKVNLSGATFVRLVNALKFFERHFKDSS